MNIPTNSAQEKTKKTHFDINMIVTWGDLAKNDQAMKFIVMTIPRDQFTVMAVMESLSGTHPQLVEIDVLHPLGLRTWICGSWLKVA